MPNDELEAGHLAALLRPAGDGPLHCRIEAGLRALILSGQLPPGSALPGEVGLAAVLGLSRHTLRHALGVLAAEGLVARERGRGTRVVTGSRLREPSVDSLPALAWESGAGGMDECSTILQRATIAASTQLAHRLNLGVDRRISRVVRIRTVGGEPLVLETSYLPATLVEDFDDHVLASPSVYDELERKEGLRITRASTTIRPTVLAASMAHVLGVHAGSPALLVETTTWLGAHPVEWLESIVRGDACIRWTFGAGSRLGSIHLEGQD